MQTALVTASVLAALLTGTAATPSGGEPLPSALADTGGGSQLITVVAAGTAATTGTLTWWDERGGRWVEAGSAPARFGSHGLTEGTTRKQGTYTTPAGLYDLPYAFGNAAPPAGTRYPYRRATARSWWCEDNGSRAYNRWAEGLPADCAGSESEHLADYPTQYARAMVVGFNYDHPVHGRGAGIFLHVDGKGSTAGCVSVPADAMASILTWADPARHPHIAIGTAGGATALTKY
ncbi:L,D-transpeptidase family protein [Streptomyces montanisoli]|uniref:L,D-transpeptidase family protein n=1 Tax=Streptomyces montanisoli TaxID=2798581 RepID=A0A940RY66_9ACTN|nr:L,D-transpeptidase family protein [Streptomyces montanisoli]MBP0461275.1 L,D-transpeptidase family protein [Streptomyces montanisoli]